jgi:prepilin-type N-terminal cleavage/methylation domain-containing protein
MLRSRATDLRPPAFTLVELLAAMVVLSLLVLLLSGAFSQVSRAWTKSSGNIEQRSNTRALADFITAELQGALLPAATVPPSDKNVRPLGDLRFVINPPEVPDQYRYADALFWQAPIATETSYGDIAEVGYFVQWDTSVPSNPRPQLCRFFVNPSISGSNGTLVKNPNFKIFSTEPADWLSGEMIKTIAPATKAKGYAGLFGENVVGLWIRSYGLDGGELPRNFDSRAKSPTETGGYLNNFKDGSRTWREQRYLPARVQISLAQLDSHHTRSLPQASEQLRALTQDGSVRDADTFTSKLRESAPAGTALADLLPGLRIYTTEVQLQNAR